MREKAYDQCTVEEALHSLSPELQEWILKTSKRAVTVAEGTREANRDAMIYKTAALAAFQASAMSVCRDIREEKCDCAISAINWAAFCVIFSILTKVMNERYHRLLPVHNRIQGYVRRRLQEAMVGNTSTRNSLSRVQIDYRDT